MQAYQIMPDDEMFRVVPIVLNQSIKSILSRPGIRVNCSLCGEEIINEREIEKEGTALCRSCAGDGFYQIVAPSVNDRSQSTIP